MKIGFEMKRAQTFPCAVAVALLCAVAGCGGYSSGSGGGGGGGSTPAVVTGLAATSANAQVNLTWNASSGATGYYVKRSTTSGTETQIAAQAGTGYTDNSVANGTKYFYVVAAYNSYGTSTDSAEVNATPTAPPPPTPTGISATAGDKQVVLAWNAVTGATSYHVKRSTSSGTEAQVSAPTTNAFTDTGLTNGTKYFYVVTAVGGSGESGNSAEVNATPQAAVSIPAVPTGLIATAGDGTASLTWTAVSGATSYHVKRSTTSGSGYAQVGAPTSSSFADSGLTDGTTYFYVVSAVNSAGESGNSSQVSATPAAAAVNVTITVDPTKTHAISPYIYGTNFYSGTTNAPTLLTFDRDGGNRWTAYNWINNGSNAGSDYFYENDNYLCNNACTTALPAEAVRMFIADDQQAGLASLITVQMQGYVSKDAQTVQVSQPFPNLTYFRPVVDKKSTASAQPFTLTPPAASTDNNVYMDEFAWALDQKFSGKNIFGTNPTHPTFVSLDNEPELWNSTHAEIQGTTMVTSDAYIAKTITLTKALKDQFPNMEIFGPVHYGFQGLYNWQGELAATPTGTNWFPDKYLQAIKTASTSYGKPLVDVYDFHWYPEEYDATSSHTRILNLTGTTLSDAQVQLIVQSPRVLWDSTFNDAANGNSNPWIYQELGNSPIKLLPRLQAKIDVENPGMKISITEYEGGGWNHIAGTIAEADYLGIFGIQNVFAASFWPPGGTYDYATAGFRAYRGFDGASAVFGDTSLQTTSSNVANVMVYASSDSTTAGHYIFVAINRSTSSQVTAINGVTLSGTAYLYQMTAASAQGQNPVHPVSIGTMVAIGNSLKVTLPALSVTTIEVK
jgi:fibronectin type 3 domain-containing protein